MGREQRDTPWMDRLATLALIAGGCLLLGSRVFPVWPAGADVAELTLCAVTGGVPHSPGYPLWTRMAELATAVQPDTHPVAAISWMVVLLGIVAAVLTRSLLRELDVGPLAATAGGVLLLVVPLCMRVFSVPEVHSLDLLLMAGSLWAVARGERTDRPYLTSLGVGLAVLAMGHRPVNAILLVVLAVGWRTSLFRSQAGLRGLGAGLGLQLLLYMDLWMRIRDASAVWVDEAALPTALGFASFITGFSFSRFFIWSPVGSGLTSPDFALGLQVWGLILAALLAPLVLRSRRMGVALLVMALGHLVFIAVYRTVDLVFFFLPVVWVGLVVVSSATRRLPDRLQTPVGGVLLLGVLGLGTVNHRSLEGGGAVAWQEDLRRVLVSVPKGAVVISDDWPVRTGLVAMREIDGVGEGVEVVRVTADAAGAQRMEEWLHGEVALVQLEEHQEIVELRPIRIFDERLLLHLRERGLKLEPAEAGTWSVASGR